MSKVVHVSDKVHAKAKRFCTENRLRMSDWVASLINEAISAQRIEPAVGTEPATVPKKKRLPKLDQQSTEGADAPPYELPPFWERAKNK